MKKRLMNLIAIVMSLGMVFIAGPVMAETPSTTTNTVGGDVTFTADWTITAPTAWTPFADISVAELRLDSMEQVNFLECTELDVNGKFKVSAKKNTWTLPGSYNGAHTDAKYKTDGTDAGLLIKVTADEPGDTGAGAMTVQNDFGPTLYKALTTTDQMILQGGVYDGGHASGVENAEFSVDAQILMDYKTTVPGTYLNTITLTFAEDAS
jgi:hypothetical protein